MNELNNWTRAAFMEFDSVTQSLIRGVKAVAMVPGMNASANGFPNVHAVCFFEETDGRDPILCFSRTRDAIDCRPVGDQPPVQFTVQPLRESGATLFYFMDPVTVDQGLGSCLRIVPEVRHV